MNVNPKEQIARANRGYDIRQCQKSIDELNHNILVIAQTYVPDFHWMRHEVSTVWKCETSDIGMCVFEKDYDDRWGEIIIGNCIYCHQPKVRK